MPLRFSLAESRHDIAWCIHIRTLVFVVGQRCPPEIEIDEYEDACRHFLGRDGGRPCATARWRPYAPGVAKVERVAVLEDWQKKGIGRDLMRHVMSDIARADAGLRTIRLGAQDYAIPFYEKLGFVVAGEGFMEAGIPHHWMQRPT